MLGDENPTAHALAGFESPPLPAQLPGAPQLPAAVQDGPEFLWP